MIINKKLKDEQWYDYTEKASFLIRNFPISELALMKDSEVDNSMGVLVKTAEYCIMDWKGIEDEDGVKFECNEENKNYLLNFYPEILTFVTESIEKTKKVKTRTVKKTSKK